MPLLYLTLLLILFGAVMQYSASSTIAINKFGWDNYNYFLYKHLSRVAVGIIAMIGICTYIAIQKWNINSPESSGFYFRQNNVFAIMLFLYLLIF